MLEIGHSARVVENVVAQPGIDAGDIQHRVGEAGALALVDLLRLAIERQCESTRLEATRRAAGQRQLALVA